MREQMKSFDEISAEGRDLLHKYGQPENLKTALEQSLRASHQDEPQSTRTTADMGETKKEMSGTQYSEF